MRSRAIAVALFLAAAGTLAASPTPLLDYALSHSFVTPPRDFEFQRRLSYSQHELERNPAPETGCAQTLGARRFAHIYHDLATAHSGLADYDRAVDAYKRALACTPRAAYIHAELAAELLHLHRYIEARAIAEQGLAVDDSENSLHRILAQLDYIEEHWGDAAEHLRTAIEAEESNESATYWQCLLWLAQRRAGRERPQLISRESAEEWPQSILATLTGGMSESELLKEIEDEEDIGRRREILAEALYYLGQRRLVDGQPDAGRRYLAATVNLKVPYFIEHHLALAELAKIRARSQAAPLLSAH